MSGAFTSLLAGQLACLSAALCWAVAVGLFRRPIETHGARTINLAKCLLAALMQGATIWVLGRTAELGSVAGRSLAFLAVSGVIGLVIGDTALFGAVARIGVHRTLLLQTLAPAFAALVAFLWLGERLTATQLGGAVLTVAGIVLVVASRREGGGSGDPGPDGSTSGDHSGRRALGLGFLLAAVAAAGQGSGVVLAKAGMDGVSAMTASFVRLSASAIGLILLDLLAGRLGALRCLARDRSGLARAVPATIIGTYLALFLMMAGVGLAPASVAAVLLSTPPVFGLIIEAVVEKKMPPPRAVFGTLLAVAGVAVLTGALEALK